MSAGGLHDLDAAGQTAWQACATSYVEDAITEFGSPEGGFRVALSDGSARVSIQWTGFPERVASCLGRRRTLELLDARPGLPGGRDLQEEYIEWRVIRRGSRIQRIELTTELADYWAVFAAHCPERLLAVVAGFAGEQEVGVRDVFGRDDALDASVSPAERESAFRDVMLGTGSSSYNDGRRAICCMRQQSNSLFGAAALAAAALTPRFVADPLDGRIRSLRCDEAVSLFWRGLAQLRRASDPLLVERLGQLAFEGRAVALDAPVCFYIRSVQTGRLRTPDGSRVPEQWFRYSRGNTGPDGQRRFQRLVFEVPEDEDICISDLVDVATERRIEFGGEIADLVSVALFFRVTADACRSSSRFYERCSLISPVRSSPSPPGIPGGGNGPAPASAGSPSALTAAADNSTAGSAISASRGAGPALVAPRAVAARSSSGGGVSATYMTPGFSTRSVLTVTSSPSISMMMRMACPFAYERTANLPSNVTWFAVRFRTVIQ